MEILGVPKRPDGAGGMKVQGGRAMGREREMMGLAESGGLKETGITTAAAGIGLQDVDGASLEHAFEVSDVVTVFAGSYVHPRRTVVAHEPQPDEIIG